GRGAYSGGLRSGEAPPPGSTSGLSRARSPLRTRGWWWECEPLGEKRPLIGVVRDLQRHGLARAVPGARPDAEQDRVRAELRRLQRGGELEAVPRHHTIVVIGGGDEGRGVAHTLPYVLHRRIGVQRLELLRV